MFCFPKQCMYIAASIHLRRGSGDIIAGHTNNGIGVPSNQRTIATTDCCNHRCIHSAYRKYALYLQQINQLKRYFKSFYQGQTSS